MTNSDVYIFSVAPLMAYGMYKEASSNVANGDRGMSIKFGDM